MAAFALYVNSCFGMDECECVCLFTVSIGKVSTCSIDDKLIMYNNHGTRVGVVSLERMPKPSSILETEHVIRMR